MASVTTKPTLNPVILMEEIVAVTIQSGHFVMNVSVTNELQQPHLQPACQTGHGPPPDHFQTVQITWHHTLGMGTVMTKPTISNVILINRIAVLVLSIVKCIALLAIVSV